SLLHSSSSLLSTHILASSRLRLPPPRIRTQSNATLKMTFAGRAPLQPSRQYPSSSIALATTQKTHVSHPVSAYRPFDHLGRSHLLYTLFPQAAINSASS